MSTSVPVVNNRNASRFEIEVDGEVAVLEYVIEPDRIQLNHTEVPAAWEGRGYASALVRTALEYAEAEHLAVVPHCPFVQAYLKRHPEYAHLVWSPG